MGLSDGFSQFENWTLWKSGWCATNKLTTGDVNGDSKADLLCKDGANAEVALSGGIVNRTDLLTTIQSSLGGTTTITYAPGTQWSNTGVAPPATLSIVTDTGETTTSPSTHRRSPGAPTVISVTVADGRGWSKARSPRRTT